MLHKAEFELMGQYLGDYTKECYGRELVPRISLSQKAIALTLQGLEKKGILTSRKSGTQKYYRLNLKNTEIKDFLLLAEVYRKIIFLQKQRILANILSYDERIVGLFGSYAAGKQNKVSDVDMFIIGTKRAEDYGARGERLDLNLSIKYFSEQDFIRLLKEKNPLLKEIVNKHIIFGGSEKFISLVWGFYYGFN